MLSFLAILSLTVFAAASTPLYGVTEQAALVQYDTSSASIIKTVTPSLPYELLAQNKGAVDNAKGIFYILGYNRSMTVPNLVGVDLTSGNIVCDQTLPFAESSFIGVGQQVMIGADSTIYVGGRLVLKGNHTVGSFDCATGKYNKIAEINSGDLPVLGGASVVVPTTDELIIQLGVADAIDNFLVNIKSGAVTKLPEDPQEGRILTTLSYDAKMDRVVGLGIRPAASGIERTIVALDAKTKAYSTLANVTGFLMESGGESALDYSSQLLTWIGQPTGATPTDPFDLITLTLQGKNVSSPNLCPNDASCPWIIHYWNRF